MAKLVELKKEDRERPGEVCLWNMFPLRLCSASLDQVARMGDDLSGPVHAKKTIIGASPYCNKNDGHSLTSEHKQPNLLYILYSNTDLLSFFHSSFIISRLTGHSTALRSSNQSIKSQKKSIVTLETLEERWKWLLFLAFCLSFGQLIKREVSTT